MLTSSCSTWSKPSDFSICVLNNSTSLSQSFCAAFSASRLFVTASSSASITSVREKVSAVTNNREAWRALKKMETKSSSCFKHKWRGLTAYFSKNRMKWTRRTRKMRTNAAWRCSRHRRWRRHLLVLADPPSSFTFLFAAANCIRPRWTLSIRHAIKLWKSLRWLYETLSECARIDPGSSDDWDFWFVLQTILDS